MQLLHSILSAAHAKGTHHHLALDALYELSVPEDDAWHRLFLKHIALYLEGAKAPDKEFKDFKNHVLHVRDGYWGGADAKTTAWQQKFVAALREQQWEEAVYCAGVMSHYFTDPVMPFHTAQSEVENNIHRAVEWSISKSFPDLRQIANSEFSDLAVAIPEGGEWVSDFVRSSAQLSNSEYERLIAHYRFEIGVIYPEDGLDAHARVFVARLIRYATVGLAAILSKSISESAAVPPSVNLTPQVVLGTLQMPLKWITKRMEDAGERRLVEAMYDELQTKGRVEDTLPEDDRIVRDLHAKEVVGPAAEVASAIAGTATAVAAAAMPELEGADKLNATATQAAQRAEAAAMTAVSPTHGRDHVAQSKEAARNANPVGAAFPSTRPAPSPRPAETQRRGLQREDEVVHAPSIGSRTAQRLNRIGVHTVGDLLAANAKSVCDKLQLSYLNPKTVGDWQSQALLRCELPGLRGQDAQLLVAGGYATPDQIAATSLPVLQAALVKVAKSSDGERILRGGQMPTNQDLSRWIAAGQSLPVADTAMGGTKVRGAA